MILRDIANFVSVATGVPVEDIMSEDRTTTFVVPRHIWRTIANVEFGYSATDIAKYELAVANDSGNTAVDGRRGAVYNSRNKIITDGVYAEEYTAILNQIRNTNPESPVAHTKEYSNITRVTKEEFDERFYHHPEKKNKTTGINWFPSWHFLYHIASPTNKFLIDYYKNKGWFSDFEFHRAEVMGSYVHNCIEDMGKYEIKISDYTIRRSFPNAKEARKVEECLQAWINFIKEEEPRVISYEQMVIADDWGGTVDLRARLKRDNYEKVWTIDFKTSKTVYESHLSQVESYRRQFGDDKAAVLLLGNNTKKRYTLSEVKAKDGDFYYKDFILIKDLAYHRLIKANRIQPTPSDMPESFSHEGLNIAKI